MLTARNVIWATVLLSIVAIVWGIISLMRPPGSDSNRHDTYGVRASGYRGLYELTEEIGVPVQRSLVPPNAQLQTSSTVVIWDPVSAILATEHAPLESLHRWMLEGGRLVIAMQTDITAVLTLSMLPEQRDPLEALGLQDVKLTKANLLNEDPDKSRIVSKGKRPTPESLNEEFFNTVGIGIVDLSVVGDGDYEELAKQVGMIAVRSQNDVIQFGTKKPAATISIENPRGQRHVVVAKFRIGRGEAILVSAPEIATNRNITRAGNSVLAAHLVAGGGERVWMDEFYHAHTIRGNPLWLFTKPGYRAAGLAFLVILALWIWRGAQFLGPRLSTLPPSRRNVSEYVEAMAEFFLRSRGNYEFVLREVRDGVLHELQQQLQMPLGHDSLEQVHASLSRRDPARATRLQEAVRDADELLNGPRRLRRKLTLPIMQRLIACL